MILWVRDWPPTGCAGVDAGGLHLPRAAHCAFRRASSPLVPSASSPLCLRGQQTRKHLKESEDQGNSETKRVGVTRLTTQTAVSTGLRRPLRGARHGTMRHRQLTSHDQPSKAGTSPLGHTRSPHWVPTRRLLPDPEAQRPPRLDDHSCHPERPASSDHLISDPTPQTRAPLTCSSKTLPGR